MMFKKFEMPEPPESSDLTPRQQMAFDAYSCARDAMAQTASARSQVLLSDYRHGVPQGFDEMFDGTFTREERGDILRAGEMAGLTIDATNFLNESILRIASAPARYAHQDWIPGKFSELTGRDKRAIFSTAKLFVDVS